ncbi:Protein ETHYLENE-INSENSITIVE 2 [Bienertia sinuspersici]
MEVGSASHTMGMAGSLSKGLLPVLAPILLISIGYIDPGKWVSCIDSGARFGADLVPFALAFKLCGGFVSLSICSEEYDKLTCFFLGLQVELSAITLDLTMIIGIAHGLNTIFGLDLFTCILLTALNAVLYPLFYVLLESSKAKFLVVCAAGIAFSGYVLGMLLSVPEFPVPANGLLSKLSGESAFALMSLLGANVMPHNFYLYSSIVQRYQGPACMPKGLRSQHNFIISFTISSGIFLVNYVLINSAANIFYSTGLGLVTFQDAMALFDQSGAEGMYHMLICTQVMVALVLPSSVIPLFRIASSRSIMGVNKISPYGEYCYIHGLCCAPCHCLHLTWFHALAGSHPLKSVTARLESQSWNWDAQQASELYTEREGTDVTERRFLNEEPCSKLESFPLLEKSLHSHPDMPTPNYDIILPETIMDTVQEPCLSAIEENLVEDVPAGSSKCYPEAEQSAASIEPVQSVSSVLTGPSNDSLVASAPMKSEPADPIVKTLRIEGDTATEKDDEGDIWESEGSSKDVAGVGRPTTPDGPGSYRSLGGKNDEGGASAGSLSRLSGLGRAARRQLAAALDEFLGTVYGETAEVANSLESAYRAHKGSASIWSNQMPFLDSYVQNSSRSMLDSGERRFQSSSRTMLDSSERRYQSLHLPPSSESLDYQPATVHGYQIASYLNRIAKERSDYMVGPVEKTPQKSPSLVPNNYRESLAFSLGQKSPNGYNSVQPSSIQNLTAQRNSVLQSDKYCYGLSAAAPAERADACSLWSRQPFEQFGVANKSSSLGAQAAGNRSSMTTPEPPSTAEMERKFAAITEALHFEAPEAGRIRMPSGTIKSDDTIPANVISSVPQCGEGCVWKADLIVSFGVWCIRRILELSLMESRPELWGKYTYVLNRLQAHVTAKRYCPKAQQNSCKKPAAATQTIGYEAAGHIHLSSPLTKLVSQQEANLRCKKKVNPI